MTRERTVLIVDDDFSVEHTLRRLLEREGFLTAIANNGHEALNLAKERTFDAALVDYKLSDTDGVHILRRIRELQPQCLRLLVSGHLDMDIVLDAVNRGEVTRVIRKPFEHHELLDNLNEALATQAHIWKAIVDGRSDDGPSLARGLQECFDQDLFQLALQPLVGASSLKVVGFEALLRCSHPDFGTPLRVLSAAEALGRIDDIADVVTAKTAGWFSQLSDKPTLFVNLHPMELDVHDRLAERTRALFPWSKRVVFEVTERERIVSHKRFAESVRVLRKQDFALALDDLGAGYSSLSMLLDLEPDYVKIDRSLVRDIHLDPKRRLLLKHLAALCKEMDTTVVGEGVEKLAEATVLREFGIDLLQGFLFGRPSFTPQTEVTAVTVQGKALNDCY